MASDDGVTYGEPVSAAGPSNATAATRPYYQADVSGGHKPVMYEGTVRVLHPGPNYEWDPLEIMSIPVWWPNFDVDYDTVMSFAFATTGVSSEEHIYLTLDRDRKEKVEKHVKLKAGSYYLFVEKKPYNVADISNKEKRPEDVLEEEVVGYEINNYPILKTITDWIAPAVSSYVNNSRVKGRCFLPSAWQRVEDYDISFASDTQCQVTGLRFELQGAHVIPYTEGVPDWWKSHMQGDKGVSLGSYPNIMKLQQPIHRTLDFHNITFAALPVEGCPRHSTRLALIVPAYDLEAHDVVRYGIVDTLHRREVHCQVPRTWELLHALYLRFLWTFVFHQYRNRILRSTDIMLLRSSTKDPNVYYVVKSRDVHPGKDITKPLDPFVVPSFPSSNKRKSAPSSYTGTPSQQGSPGLMGPPGPPRQVRTPTMGGKGQQAMSDAVEADYNIELDEEPIFTSVENWLYKTPDDGPLNTPGLTTGTTALDRSDSASDDFDARLAEFPDDDVFTDRNPPGQNDNPRQGGSLFADDGTTKRVRQDDVDLQEEQHGHVQKTHLSAEEGSEQVLGHPKVVTSQVHNDSDVFI